MKTGLYILVSGLLMTLGTTVASQTNTRIVENFDENWRFFQGDAQNASDPKFDDRSWRLLDVPHDWSVEGTVNEKAPAGGQGGYFPTGTGWYRKHFILKKSDLKMENSILFDGVYMNSTVWLNGKLVGNYPFGYNSFYYDLNSFLKEGDNIIVVEVDNSRQPNSRWYSGSGIYRHVWLIRTNQIHISQWGVYITTPEISEQSASIRINTRIGNDIAPGRKVSLISIVEDDKGVEAGNIETPLPDGKEPVSDQTIRIQLPRLWSPESPVMYTLVSKISVDGRTVDEVKTPFGIRDIRYDVEKGFLLNGKNVKMKGVCLHHEGGAVGSAVPVKVWERRLNLLKEMGCNAIRTSHNPVAPEFLDLCDRMGFLVMDEIFDEWKRGKVQFGYNIYFDQWAEKDVVSFVMRDRNHPSVVMWSAGNEIREQPVAGGEIPLRKLLDIFHAQDPTRPVTVGCDNIAADDNPARMEFLNLLDIVGYNYVDRWHERRELFYSIDRINHPTWKMVGTESVSNGGIRGDYNFGRDSSRINPNYNTRMIRVEQL